MVKFKKFLYRLCPILVCFVLVFVFISPCFVSAAGVINYLDYVTSVVEYSDYNLITCDFPVTMSYIYAAWRYLEDVDYQPVDDIEFTSRTGSLSTTFNFGDIPIQEHQTFWLNIVPFADCLDIRSFASNIQLSYSFSLFFDTDVDLDYSSGNVLSGSNTLYTFDQTCTPEVYGDLAIDIYNKPVNYTRLGQVQEFNASFSLDEATVTTYPYIACQTELRGFNVDTIANSWYIDVTINSCRLYFQVAKDNPINDDITQALDRNNQKLDEMVNGTIKSKMLIMLSMISSRAIKSLKIFLSQWILTSLQSIFRI